jgi:hypothetical protein
MNQSSDSIVDEWSDQSMNQSSDSIVDEWIDQSINQSEADISFFSPALGSS